MQPAQFFKILLSTFRVRLDPNSYPYCLAIVQIFVKVKQMGLLYRIVSNASERVISKCM
jgi:hypothetical protein